MLCIIKAVFQLYNILHKIAVICVKLWRICVEDLRLRVISLICIFVMKATRLVESLINEHHQSCYYNYSYSPRSSKINYQKALRPVIGC